MDSEMRLVIREKPAAKMLGVSVAALRKWRQQGTGPSFVRLGRCVAYRLRDLESFLAENLQPTRK